MENLPEWQDLAILGHVNSQPGLRERKKQATRAAIGQAAWRLMIERGIDAVTPEAVAEAADVSPRTFRNYFASREEAIVHALLERGAEMVELVRARPAGEPIWDSLMAILPAIALSFAGHRDGLAVLMREIKQNPAMLAYELAAMDRGRCMMAEVIAERTGTDLARDVAPRLLAEAAGSAVRIAMEIWLDGQTDVPLADLIDDALTQLRAGLPFGG